MYLSAGFFFKQKTAYEMRISDWSSDVCSSDLRRRQLRASAQSAWRIDHDRGQQAGGFWPRHDAARWQDHIHRRALRHRSQNAGIDTGAGPLAGARWRSDGIVAGWLRDWEPSHRPAPESAGSLWRGKIGRAHV